MINILSTYIHAEKSKILEYLLNPFNLKEWTVHTNLSLEKGICYETIVFEGEVSRSRIKVEKFERSDEVAINFQWILEERVKKNFQFILCEAENGDVLLTVEIPVAMEDEKLEKLKKLLGIEFGLLEQILQNKSPHLSEDEKLFMNEYHKNLR